MRDRETNRKLLHLYRRAAFGAIPAKNTSPGHAVNLLFEDSETFVPISLVSISAETTEIPAMDKMMLLSDSEKGFAKKEKNKMERERVKDLNMAWMDLMANSKGVLRERMALFWHGHFACRSQNPVFVQNYINTIRKNALGNFGQMLLEVSKEPAMLQFLNNQQNKKRSPNENFAREVMELFTMGRGNYSEDDVKESARAFTGWSYNASGEFEFKAKVHDGESKKFLGRQGAFDGADIIAILLKQRETALFVTKKIYQSFVSEIPDVNRIQKLADDFYASDYDIEKLMRTIFKADWFYDESPQNVLIKSPVELIVGIQRTLFASFRNKQSALYIQKVLGQVLFYPPNVAGWPGGRNWIDSSSLLFRMQLPGIMIGNAETNVKAKESGDVNDPVFRKPDKNLKAEVNWEVWAERFEKTEPDKVTQEIADQLLAQNPNESVFILLDKRVSGETDLTQKIRKITLAIMALPEYQVS
jgi:uncharacterized protein (DUF1800 family)